MFALDGQTFNIKNLLVNFSREFKDQDMSGMASLTATSEQGDKAAELEISGLIAFKDLAQLALLESMSSAKDESGDRKVYRVANDVANALKLKMPNSQATFPPYSKKTRWRGRCHLSSKSTTV